MLATIKGIDAQGKTYEREALLTGAFLAVNLCEKDEREWISQAGPWTASALEAPNHYLFEWLRCRTRHIFVLKSPDSRHDITADPFWGPEMERET
jgi:hypothetical protein